MSITASKFRFVSRQLHAANTRHVFRALLREATYLPDAAARQYITKHIKHRFQNGRERATLLLQTLDIHHDEAKKREDATRELEQQLRKAWKGLYQLTRANEGELRPLMQVLRYTYGRNGPRRYELLRSVMVADPDIPPSPPSKRWNVPLPPQLKAPETAQGANLIFTLQPNYTRLHALLTSQAARNIPSQRTRLIAKLSIPARNTWGRPMPRKRVKNMVAKKWAKLLDALLPPLPASEWTQLRDLATGVTLWGGARVRRKRTDGHPERLMPSDLEKLAHLGDGLGDKLYLDQHLASPTGASKEDKLLTISETSGYWNEQDIWLASPEHVDDALDTVLEDELGIQTLNKNLSGRDRGHKITPRLMRRLWTRVWEECPMVERAPPNEDGRVWNVVWGKGPKVLDACRKREPDGRLDELFGVGVMEQKVDGGGERAVM